MHRADAPGLHEGHVLLRDPHAVGGEGGGGEGAQVVKPLGRGLAVLGHALVVLLLGLGQVDVHPAAQGLAVGAVGLHDVGEVGVLGVDGKVDEDAAVLRAVVGLVELDGLSGPNVFRVGLRGVEALVGPAEVCLDACLPGVFHSGVGPEVHIGVAGGAGGDHLQQGQGVAHPDVLLGELVLDGHHLFKEPLLEGQVAAHAPQQRHGGVAVAVDETRAKELSAHVLFLVVGRLGGLVSQVVDGVAVDAQVSVFDPAVAVGAVGGQDVAVF